MPYIYADASGSVGVPPASYAQPLTRRTLFFCLVYATAQLTPSAVPTAARIADARFHRNFISLDLFSLVIGF